MSSGTRTSAAAAAHHRWRIAAWGLAAALLVLPLVAMQFTDEVAWSTGDFVLFGAMLATAGGLCEVVVRATGDRAYRAAAAIAVATAFLLVLINGAVGLIGSEDDPANRVLLAVLAVGAVGAGVARFRPRGTARAMAATALAQAGMAAVALGVGDARAAAATLCFVAPWLLSAWLFRKAARVPAGGADNRARQAARR